MLLNLDLEVQMSGRGDSVLNGDPLQLNWIAFKLQFRQKIWGRLYRVHGHLVRST